MINKGIVLFGLLFFITPTSCTSYRAFYNIDLLEIIRPQKTMVQCGEGVIKKQEGNGGSVATYLDKMITATWITGDYQLNMTVKNNLDQPITVLWENCAYIDENGKSHRVIYSGSELVARKGQLPPTILAKQDSLQKQIIPFDYIKFEKDIKNGWTNKPLFPYSSSNENDMRKIADTQVGKSFKVRLSLENSNVIHEYLFVFKITGVDRVKPVQTHF